MGISAVNSELVVKMSNRQTRFGSSNFKLYF